MADRTAGWIRENVTHRVFWTALGVMAVGSVLVWLGTPDSEAFWGEIVAALGGALFAVGALSVVWQLVARRAFTQELLAKIGLAQDVEASRLRRIRPGFRDPGPDWPALLDQAKQLDCFVCWARTWREQYTQPLRRILGRDNGRIRVVLPDPDNSVAVATLVSQFETCDAETVRRNINEAISFFKALGEGKDSADSVLEIWVTPRVPFISFYRVDDQVVIAFYAQRGKEEVPTLVAQAGGYLYNFFSQDLEFLASTRCGARLVYPQGESDGVHN